MGWFDVPAGQANLLAGMSNIASHKIAEPNIGSAITSGLDKAVDAIKNRNDALIKEEANAKVREILAQPMDAKNPMATQQLLAQWLPRADEKHQMIGKDAIANAYQGANYQTGQERLGLEKGRFGLEQDRFANQKEVSERDFKQKQLEHADMIKHQAAQLDLSQKQYEIALEANKIGLAQKDKELRGLGFEYDKKTGELTYNPEIPEFKASIYQKIADDDKSFIQLNSIDKLKANMDSRDLFGGIFTSNSRNYDAIGAGISKLGIKPTNDKEVEEHQNIKKLLAAGDYNGLEQLLKIK